MAEVGLIIPPPSTRASPADGPGLQGQGRSAGGVLHLDLVSLARSPIGGSTATG